MADLTVAKTIRDNLIQRGVECYTPDANLDMNKLLAADNIVWYGCCTDPGFYTKHIYLTHDHIDIVCAGIGGNIASIPYSDPELYAKIDEILDRAYEQ